MGASFLPLMMFTLLWGGVGIVLPFLVPKGASQVLPDNGNEQEGQHLHQHSESAFLSFHPKYFDFKESPVGVPRLGVVRVDNRLKNENLKLISISGNTVHFHSSFFADKVIGPESNTTFEVVFLSRVEGLVESNLYIHTSKGLYKYYVKGFGLPNPYRLRPLVGARIPVNGTYEPLITMHNTHDTRIQVVEMHSSGADFHLQLPDDVEQDAGTAWAIDPFQTKSVMKGSFLGKADGNHTGFIKIRVNSTTASSEYLLLPVEVQVSSEPGMYSPQDSLDFGLLVQTDKPKTLSLFIINAERKPVNIQSVAVKGSPNPAVKIEFRPLVIEPDNSVSTVVALVTFDPTQAFDYKHSHGMIQILSECGKSVSVPFRASVMHGALEYNASSLGFFVKSDHIPPRNFSVRNNFSATVAIYQVAVSHPDLVKVNSFNQTHIIPPGEQKAIFSMKIQRKGDICDARNKIEVTVKSNITNIRLPLVCYDGKLQMHTFENGEIDCGRVELYSTHTEYFSIENKNPVEIRLKSWGSNSSWGHVELVGMQKGVKEDLERIKDFDSLKKSKNMSGSVQLFLQPGHMAIFSIEVRRPTVEGTFYGEAYVTTDHNQTLRVPFRFAVSKGSVYADTFVFDKMFPGKISCEKLYLGSTFNRTLLLNAIRSKPPKLLWFTPSTGESPEILPMRRSFVGKVHFDPRRFCDSDCYSGFTLDTPVGKQWIKAINLGWEGSELDWDVFSTLQKRFESIGDSTVSNISVWIDTTEVGGYKVLTQINYIWPRIASLRPIVFPLTAIGNESIAEIPVSNPSSFPLIVQAVLASEYGPQWSRFVSASPNAPSNLLSINSFSSTGNFSAGELAFKLSGILSSSSQQNGSTDISEVQTQLFQETLGNKENSSGSLPSPLRGVVFVLPPGAKYFLRTAFKPQSKDIASSVILLRNNLTGIEVISVKGRAGTGQLTVGSGTPGSSLHFQLTEKLLSACQAEPTSKYVPPQLTVRRSFIARNIGEIPLDIRRLEVYPPQHSLFGFNWQWQLPFGIGGSALFGSGAGYSAVGEFCEGYGFRILNCHPFTLQPNHTHSIDIAFSPDFTMSKVVRTLRLVDSNGGEFNYTLVAMIPSKMLSICSSVISRPNWEYLLKIFLVIGVTVAIIASALMAYVEAGSVVSSTVVATVRVLPSSEVLKDGKENTSKLDLKAVYDKVENRFKRNNKDSSKSGNSASSSGPASSLNAVGNGVSAAGSRSNQSITSGASVLSNNNNSALRNRRPKKGALENNSISSVISSTTAKLLDKSNQKSSSPPADDSITSCSSANNFSKKNKENSPSGLSGDSVNNSVTGKKKKVGASVLTSNTQSNAGNKKKRRNSGGSGSLSNVCLITGQSVKIPSKTEMEETSSTTTESSNSDDFYIPPSDKKMQQGVGKNSRTSSPQETEARTSQQKQTSVKQSNKDGNKKNKGTNEGIKLESDVLGIFDSGSSQKESSPTEEIANAGSSSSKKSKAKRKELLNYNVDSVQTSSKVASDGKNSPTSLTRHHGIHHSDISSWDSSQCSTGDGLNEMTAQAEAFVMHRPSSSLNQHGKKSGSAEHLIGSASSHDSRHSRNSQSPQFSQVLQMNSPYGHITPHQQQQFHMSGGMGPRHRRPPAGIIGQSRYGFGSGNGMMPPSGTYFQGQNNGPQYQGMKQHTPPMRTLSNPGGNMMAMANNWGADILPDNGCDIWSRKNSGENVGSVGGGNSISQTFTSAGSTSNHDLPMYSSGNVMNTSYSSIFDGFPTSSSPGLSNRSSDDGGYFSLGNNNNGSGGGLAPSTAQASSAASYTGNSGRNSGRSRNDNSQMFGGYGMDIFNALNMPLSSNTFDASMQFRTSSSGRQNQMSNNCDSTPTNYLQRMRCETSPRDDANGFASKNWNDLYLLDNAGLPSQSRLMSRTPNSPSNQDPKPDTDRVWSTSSAATALVNSVASGGSNDSLASRERNYMSEWASLAASTSMQAGRRSVGNVSEIWEPANMGSTHDPTANKWPTFENQGSDSVVIGSGARVSNARIGDGLGDLGFRPSTRSSDVPQNHHREVEAGLGFNPFTSNIWNQNNSSDANWSSSSSTYYNNRD